MTKGMSVRLRALVAMSAVVALLAGSGSQAAAQPWPWTTWTEHEGPVHSRYRDPDRIASDPTVIHDGDLYRMVYTGPKVGSPNSTIIMATSTDGITWADVPTNDGVIFEGRPGAWDEHIETAFLLKRETDYLLYYAGYKTPLTPLSIPEADIGVARSTDGVNFTRVGSDPVLRRTRWSYDSTSLLSPSVIRVEGTYYMAYTAWCLVLCLNTTDPLASILLMGATSADGITWTKRPDPVLRAQDYNLNAADEATLVNGPDGGTYLFFSGDFDTGPLGLTSVTGIGVARSFTSPFGPWEIHPGPILVADQNFERTEQGFPTVLFEPGLVRLWYTGVKAGNDFLAYQIGYAESPAFPG